MLGNGWTYRGFIKLGFQLGEEAEKMRFWLWIHRKESRWGHTPLSRRLRGWQEDFPNPVAPQPGDSAEGETLVNGGLQPTIQQLPTLAMEEAQQSASMDPKPDPCNVLQRKTNYSLQQPNKAILKKAGECLNQNEVHALTCRAARSWWKMKKLFINSASTKSINPRKKGQPPDTWSAFAMLSHSHMYNSHVNSVCFRKPV